MSTFNFDTFVFHASSSIVLAQEYAWVLDRIDPKAAKVIGDCEDSMLFYGPVNNGDVTEEQIQMFINDYEDSINALDEVRDLGLELQHEGLKAAFLHREEVN